MSRLPTAPHLRRTLLFLLCSAAVPAASAYGQGAAAIEAASLSEDRRTPLVVIEPDAGDMVRVTIRLPAGEPTSRVASYQGELTLAADRMRVARVVFPTGVLGSWHQASPDRLRFAGAAPVPAERDIILTLHVSARQPVRPGDVTVALEELTMTNGTGD